MIFKSDQPQGDLNGFLDAGSHIKGELQFEDTFRVEGRITGNVASPGELVVGEKGEVEGEIRVGRLVVSGTVKGLVHAQRKVEVAPTGRVFADLETPVLVLEEGAFLQGHCTMTRPEAVAAAKPAAAKVVTALKERSTG